MPFQAKCMSAQMRSRIPAPLPGESRVLLGTGSGTLDSGPVFQRGKLKIAGMAEIGPRHASVVRKRSTKTPVYILVVLFLLVPITSWAVSFDCEKAATAVERLICSDRELGALDDATSAAYKEALKSKGQDEILVHDQKVWLKDTRGACRDAGCIKKVYSERIEELRSWNRDVANSKDYFGVYVIKDKILVYDGDRDRWEPKEVENCLALAPDGENSVKFSFVLIHTNGHQCQMDGVATLVGNHLEFRPPSEQGPSEEQNQCLLRIKVRKHSIILEDNELMCRTYYCGARAGIDGWGFDRKHKVEKAKDEACNAFSKGIRQPATK